MATSRPQRITRESCMAASYVHDGLADYEYDRYKSQSLVCMYNYRATGRVRYLNDAIHSTRVAIELHKLTKGN